MLDEVSVFKTLRQQEQGNQGWDSHGHQVDGDVERVAGGIHDHLGNHRCECTTQDSADGVSDGSAGVANLSREHLGVHGRLRAEGQCQRQSEDCDGHDVEERALIQEAPHDGFPNHD